MRVRRGHVESREITRDFPRIRRTKSIGTAKCRESRGPQDLPLPYLFIPSGSVSVNSAPGMERISAIFKDIIAKEGAKGDLGRGNGPLRP